MRDKILIAREERYNLILELIEGYQLPIICAKLNYPGNNKNTPRAKKAFRILKELTSLKFKSHYVLKQDTRGADGSSLLMVVNLEARKAKEMAMDIEVDHGLGRIFDIDIYGMDGSSLGRENLGVSGRKCVVCNEEARICIGQKKHGLEDTINSIDRLIEEYDFKS